MLTCPEMRVSIGAIAAHEHHVPEPVKALVGKRLARPCGSSLSAWTEIDADLSIDQAHARGSVGVGI